MERKIKTGGILFLSLLIIMYSCISLSFVTYADEVNDNPYEIQTEIAMSGYGFVLSRNAFRAGGEAAEDVRDDAGEAEVSSESYRTGSILIRNPQPAYFAVQ